MIPNDEFYLSSNTMKWVKKLQKHLDNMPEDIEILVGIGAITVHQKGWYQESIYDAGVDMMFASQKINDDCNWIIPIDVDKVRPNSESI